MPDTAEVEILEGMEVELEPEAGAEVAAPASGDAPPPDAPVAQTATSDDDEAGDTEFDAKVGQQLYGPWKERVESLKKKRDAFKAEAAEAKALREQNARLKAEHEQALQYAYNIRQTAEHATARLAQLEPAYKTEAVRARQQILESLQGQLAIAMESGDHARAAEINRAMIAAQQQHQQFEAWTPQKPADLPAAPQVSATPSDRGENWLRSNPWFNAKDPKFDAEMHAYAMAVDNHVLRSGYVADSEAYYREIDRYMRNRFTDRLTPDRPATAAPKAPPSMPVVNGQRQSPNGSTKFTTRVTAEDIAVAASIERASGRKFTGADVAKQRLQNQIASRK